MREFYVTDEEVKKLDRAFEKELLEAAKDQTVYDIPDGAKLSELIDTLFKKNKERRAADAVAKRLKEEEPKLPQAVRGALNAAELEGATGARARAKIKYKDSYRIADSQAFWGWVKREDAYDLIRTDLLVEPCKAREEEGIAVPGINKYTAESIGLVKPD